MHSKQEVFGVPFVVELLEELLGRGTVHLRRGARVDVVADTQLFKRLLDDFVIAVNDVLRRAAFLFGFDGNRHAMLVGTTDKQDVLATHSQITNVSVGGDITPAR